MKNLWDPAEAAKCRSDLELRVYTSRLLGRENTLVLHGGGNTSVKVREKNVVGEEEEILYVKGSGWDLETIEVNGFTPVRMAVTGSKVSPGLFESLELLGREESLRRLSRAAGDAEA